MKKRQSYKEANELTNNTNLNSDNNKNEKTNYENKNDKNKNSNWDEFFGDKKNPENNLEKDFYNSNFNRSSSSISEKEKENSYGDNSENMTFTREKNVNYKPRSSGNSSANAKRRIDNYDVNYESNDNDGNEDRILEEYAYTDDKQSNEPEPGESDKLGRLVDSPKINKHIVLNKMRNYKTNYNNYNDNNNNGLENQNENFNNDLKANINNDNDLKNNKNNLDDNNFDNYAYNNKSYNIKNNTNSRSNNNNRNSNDYEDKPKTRNSQRSHRASQLSSNANLDPEEAEGASESIQSKEKKLLNKLTQFIQNFEKWQYNLIFAKHLNIDVDLISYDLIKKFEDDLKNDKILLRDLALDLCEFYPKLRSFRRYKQGSLKLDPRNSSSKFMFIKKLLSLTHLFDGIVKEEIYVDNFIFFEPLAQFIKENIAMHTKNIAVSKKVLNFKQPEDFFPLARKMKRKFVYHMGPTNSGKTSNALERLVQASSGIYLAPLRLLAWEVYEKLSKKGVKCTLLTGQDRVYVENESHYSMTIEKCDFRRKFEVAVIDEIQMIEDYERGSAWTNAVLGVQADEVHLCGDERGFHLLKQLCDKTNDELYFKRYSRFSNLIVEQNTFDYADLRKGDCIIAFAKTKIMEIKRRIVEAKYGDMDACAVIYGDLPSETKKDQARMFNELTFSSSHNGEVKYDYLVASDAVKIFLNLK
jgi:hypothetical protein